MMINKRSFFNNQQLMEKRNLINEQSDYVYILPILLITFCLLVCVRFYMSVNQRKQLFTELPTVKCISKSIVYNLYGVNKRTFHKWIHYFTNLNLEVYKQKRMLSYNDFKELAQALGLPSEETPVWSKAQIVKHCDSDKATLRACVLLAPYRYGLTRDAYCRLSVFPPKVVEGIVKYFY